MKKNVEMIYLQYERGDGRIDDLVRQSRFFETLRFLRRLRPLAAHAQNPRNHTRLLAAPHVRMCVEHRTHQRRTAPRHAPDENQRHGLIIGKVSVLRVVDVLDGVFRDHTGIVATAARLQVAVVERQDHDHRYDEKELPSEALHRHGYGVSAGGAGGERPRRRVSSRRRCVRRSFSKMNIL